MTLEPYTPSVKDDIQQAVEEERARSRGYRDTYEEMHPFPKQPTRRELSFMVMMGLEATILYITSFAGLVLAALRTGAIFMIAEQTLLDAFNFPEGPIKIWLPRAAMAVALLCFEGFLFGSGLIKGKESGKIKVDWWGVGMAFAVSSVAGIASSLPLTGTNQYSTGLAGVVWSTLMWILVILSGVGATIMAYLGADNIGVLYNKHTSQVKAINTEYEQRTQEWWAGLEEDYRKKGGRTVLFGEQKWAQAARGGGEETLSPRGRQRKSREESGADKVRRVMQERGWQLSMIGDGPEFTIQPIAISDATGVTPGNVRTILSRMRDEAAKGN